MRAFQTGVRIGLLAGILYSPATFAADPASVTVSAPYSAKDCAATLREAIHGYVVTEPSLPDWKVSAVSPFSSSEIDAYCASGKTIVLQRRDLHEAGVNQDNR